MTNQVDFAAGLKAEIDIAGQALAAKPAHFAPELQKVLDGLEPLDFRQLAGIGPNERMKKADWLVLAIRETLAAMERAGAGLTCSNGLPYIYTGRYWRGMPKEEIQAFLTAAAIACGIEPLEAQYFDTQDKFYKQVQATARLQAPRRAPGQILINFQNGTLEISQGQRIALREHRPGDFLKYELPYNYDPKATSCPLFSAYLNRVQPDSSARAVLAEYVANALAPELNLQKALVLYGPGANGKSVFCDIVTALLGRDNVSSYTMASLTKEDSRSRADLENKLLNYSGEGSLKLNAETFKTLVCGEPIEARRLFNDSFTMERYAKLMFNCNELPRDIEHTEGYFRRFLIIPFETMIPERERDPELSAKIISRELPAVFNWVLLGLQRLMAAKAFTECKAAREALDTYRRESNSVSMFIEDRQLEPGTDPQKDRVPLVTMYSAYRAYCSEAGFFSMNKNTFAKQIRGQGYHTARDSRGAIVFCKGFTGIINVQ